MVTLPGVGRKTANVVLGNAYGIPGITVDTHFGRLSRRFGWTTSDDPVKVEAEVGALFPRSEWVMLSHRLIWHGRRICHAPKPACGVCPVADWCPSYGLAPADAAAAAALREAAEETGLDPAGVDVLGALPELFIERSQFRVIPVLAWWREPSAVRPADIGEVAAVERIPVADLADPAHRFMFRHPSGRTGPAFHIGSMLIWGFTGLLTDRLLAPGGWQRPWGPPAIRAPPDAA